MSAIQLKNGIPSAFGLCPGVSTIEDIEKEFGAIENIESINGADLYSFSNGSIQAAKDREHSTIATLWVSCEVGPLHAMPESLAQMQQIFQDLRVAQKPENGILLAECKGVKVACDLSDQWEGSQKIIWLELTRPD